MAKKEKVSGAPDGKPVIWDENNVLVQPELKKHFEDASKQVLRTDDEQGKKLKFDLDAPRKAQEDDSMTAEPTTSPQPSSDPNQIPTPINISEPEVEPEPETPAPTPPTPTEPTVPVEPTLPTEPEP